MLAVVTRHPRVRPSLGGCRRSLPLHSPAGFDLSCTRAVQSRRGRSVAGGGVHSTTPRCGEPAGVRTVATVAGPDSYGTGTWPHKDFSDVTDTALRETCELMADIAEQVTRYLTPSQDRPNPPSRREYATRVGVGHDTLIDVLKGRQFPRIDRLVAIGREAGVHLGVLYDGPGGSC